MNPAAGSTPYVLARARNQASTDLFQWWAVVIVNVVAQTVRRLVGRID